MRRLMVLLLALLVPVGGAQAWTWPTEGALLRPFAFGGNPYLGGLHRGIDVAGVGGEPVRAPAGGVVSFAGSVPSGGKTVTIQTADGYAVTLVHLGSIGVLRGAVVAEGHTVGTIGSSGAPEVADPYVHLGVRISAEEQGYVDPLRFLEPRPVQVPTGVAPSPPAAAPAPSPPPVPASAPPTPVPATPPPPASPIQPPAPPATSPVSPLPPPPVPVAAPAPVPTAVSPPASPPAVPVPAAVPTAVTPPSPAPVWPPAPVPQGAPTPPPGPTASVPPAVVPSPASPAVAAPASSEERGGTDVAIPDAPVSSREAEKAPSAVGVPVFAGESPDPGAESAAADTTIGTATPVSGQSISAPETGDAARSPEIDLFAVSRAGGRSGKLQAGEEQPVAEEVAQTRGAQLGLADTSTSVRMRPGRRFADPSLEGGAVSTESPSPAGEGDNGTVRSAAEAPLASRPPAVESRLPVGPEAAVETAARLAADRVRGGREEGARGEGSPAMPLVVTLLGFGAMALLLRRRALEQRPRARPRRRSPFDGPAAAELLPLVGAKTDHAPELRRLEVVERVRRDGGSLRRLPAASSERRADRIPV